MRPSRRTAPPGAACGRPTSWSRAMPSCSVSCMPCSSISWRASAKARARASRRWGSRPPATTGTSSGTPIRGCSRRSSSSIPMSPARWSCSATGHSRRRSGTRAPTGIAARCTPGSRTSRVRRRRPSSPGRTRCTRITSRATSRSPSGSTISPPVTRPGSRVTASRCSAPPRASGRAGRRSTPRSSATTSRISCPWTRGSSASGTTRTRTPSRGRTSSWRRWPLVAWAGLPTRSGRAWQRASTSPTIPRANTTPPTRVRRRRNAAPSCRSSRIRWGCR